MKISTKKALWWWLLAFGVGGDLMFFGLAGEWGLPKGKIAWINAWPVLTTILVLIAIRQLALCSLEPAHAPGQWHLRITDLVYGTLIAALVFTSFQQLWSEMLLRVGIPLGLLSAVGFLGGALAGARIGIVSSSRRTVYALGYLFRIFGALSTSGILCYTSILVIGGNPTSQIYQELIGDTSGGPMLLAATQYTILTLPLGLFLCWLATRGLPKELPPPKKDDVTSSPPDGTNGGA